MNANEYQELAGRTLIAKPDAEYTVREISMVWAALRASIVAGSIADYAKKGIFHQHGIDWDQWKDDAFVLQTHAQDLTTLPFRTSSLWPDQVMLLWNCLGLAGETSEVVHSLLTKFYSGMPLDKDELTKELGDVLWYVAALCTKLDISLDDAMQTNIDKLNKHYPDGYSSAASKHKEGRL